MGQHASMVALTQPWLQPALTPCSPLLPDSRVLQLPHLQISSSGTYTCVALNAAGQDEKRFILTVHGERQGLNRELCPPGAH